VFENQYLNQGFTNREVVETLDEGWRLLSLFPPSELRRVTQKTLDEYYERVAKTSRYYEKEAAA